jgi:hypothetical protein
MAGARASAQGFANLPAGAGLDGTFCSTFFKATAVKGTAQQRVETSGFWEIAKGRGFRYNRLGQPSNDGP